MEHPDDEVLTQFALDDPLALDAATLVHISDCDKCTNDIQEIQRVVDAALAAGGRSDLRTLVEPPPAVWDHVLVGVGGTSETAQPDERRAVSRETGTAASASTAASTPPAEAAADEPVWLFDQPGELRVESRTDGDDSLDQPTDRRTVWQIAAAAAVGLVIGAGVAWVVSDSNSEPTVSGNVTTSDLTGVDGNVTSGVISIVQQGGGAPEITVNLDTLDRGQGFIEAWLIDADTGGMIALGVIDGTQGTFTVPPSLNLSKYNQVDVSREPFDGDPAHSTVSLARGPVPPL